MQHSLIKFKHSQYFTVIPLPPLHYARCPKQTGRCVSRSPKCQHGLDLQSLCSYETAAVTCQATKKETVYVMHMTIKVYLLFVVFHRAPVYLHSVPMQNHVSVLSVCICTPKMWMREWFNYSLIMPQHPPLILSLSFLPFFLHFPYYKPSCSLF